VRHVLARRIAQLSAMARRVLVIASVAGPDFYAWDVTRTMVGDRHGVLIALDEAATNGLIIETEPPGTYRFTHALVRHTLYEGISQPRRAELHWQIAEAMRAGRPAGQRLNQVAYHCQLGLDAGDPDVAVQWLQAAGDHAFGQVAFEEAIKHYRAALAALDLGSDDPDRRYELLAGLAESADALSDFNVSAGAWLAAAEIARSTKDSARFFRAVVGYGSPIRAEAADPSFARLIAQGLELVGPTDSGERAQLLGWGASTLYQGHTWRPIEERERTVLEAMEMARRIGDRTAQSWVLGSLAQLLTGSSRPAELQAVSEQHLHSIETHGLLFKRGPIYKRLALASIQMGRRSDASDWLTRAETMARAENRQIDLHNVLMMRAAMAIAEGCFDEAKSLAARSHEIGRGNANIAVALAYGGQVSAIRAEEGRHEKVIASLRALAADASPVTIAWRSMLAALYAETGRVDDAEALFESVTPDRFAILPRDWSFPLAIRYLAELCVHFGDSERAYLLLPEVRPFGGQLLVATMGTSIEGAADRSLGHLYALVGRRDEADRCYESASQLEDSMGFSALATRTRYWHARLLVTSGDANSRLRARDLLHSALSTSSDLGMVLLHRQARDLYDWLDHAPKSP
jgi:tetratricopeptide (TPR) repeat protein